MGTTPKWKLPYPAGGDLANVPVDMKALCDRLELLLSQVGATGDLVWSVLVARPGAVLCDGHLYDSVADPSFANLFAAIGTSYGGTGASSFGVPDIQGRMLVCRGSHADVAALGASDQLALASRTPKHNSTNALSFAGAAGNTGTVSADHAHYVSGQSGGRSAQHTHGMPAGSGGFNQGPLGQTDQPAYYSNGTYGEGEEHTHAVNIWSGGISANHTHAFTPAGSIGGAIGPGGSRPVDTPSFIVENCFIVK